MVATQLSITGASPMQQPSRVFCCAVLVFVYAAMPAHAGPAPTPATKPAIKPEEQIQFQQKNVSAQMQELQERMYHLAELTRQAEPDDAARLLLAVRRAREQLIIEQMKDILERLGRNDYGNASEQQKQVLVKLEELRKLLLATDLDLQMQLERLKKLQATIAKLDTLIKEQKRQQEQSRKLAETQKTGKLPESALAAPKQDQDKTQKATESVAQTVKEFGQSGAKALEALAGAGGSMGGASKSLGGGKPGDAMPQQGDAAQSLTKAREALEQERKKLLAEIEKQVRRQVIENLTDMLERQKAVREATEVLSAKLVSAQRESVLRLKQLATPEQRIVTAAQQTIDLIEETQFSVALPAALRSVQRRCVYVTADLQAGRGGKPVVDAEKQIEKDLSDLIETFKELNSSSASGGGKCNSCGGNRNKLLAELKVARLLQVRVNEETLDADGRRAAAAAEVSPELREVIGTVRDNQAQVQDAMDKLHHEYCPDCLKE